MRGVLFSTITFRPGCDPGTPPRCPGLLGQNCPCCCKADNAVCVSRDPKVGLQQGANTYGYLARMVGKTGRCSNSLSGRRYLGDVGAQPARVAPSGQSRLGPSAGADDPHPFVRSSSEVLTTYFSIPKYEPTNPTPHCG